MSTLPPLARVPLLVLGLASLVTGVLAACGNNNATNVGSVGVDWQGDGQLADFSVITSTRELFKSGATALAAPRSPGTADTMV